MVCPQPGATNKAGEQNPALPRSFIQLDAKNRHNVDCTSHELNALNSRLKDATNDCMVLTEQVSTYVLMFALSVQRCMFGGVKSSGGFCH